MLILNKIQLTGRVGKISANDYNDKHFVTIRMAVTDKYTKQEEKPESTWFAVVLTGKGGEFAEKYVAVGDFIYVEGKLKPRTYTDREGKEHTELNVYANEVQTVLRKQDKPEEQTTATQAPVNPHLAELMDNGDDLPL